MEGIEPSTRSPIECNAYLAFVSIVVIEGLEPPLPFGKSVLSASRLPFRHMTIKEITKIVKIFW